MGNLRDEKNIEETLEVNEMLVDAIKAKLAILDEINWLRKREEKMRRNSILF